MAIDLDEITLTETDTDVDTPWNVIVYDDLINRAQGLISELWEMKLFANPRTNTFWLRYCSTDFINQDLPIMFVDVT